MSKPTAFDLFQLVWHFLKRFGIFYKWFGIFCSLGPGNPDKQWCSADKRCGNASKKIAILKQLKTHFKAKREKDVGTLFSRVPAPLYPCV